MRISASMLDRRVRIERPIAKAGFRASGSGTWELVAEAAANVVDTLPSRSEQAGVVPMHTRRSRVRMRFRADITPDMRLVLGGRVMQIKSGPVEIGRRDGIEMMVEDYSIAGNPA